MQINKFSIPIYNESEIVEAVRINPDTNLHYIIMQNSQQYNNSVDTLYSVTGNISEDMLIDRSVEEYHKNLQSKWKMPKEYLDLDIAKYLLDLCDNDNELQRMGEELLLFQEFDLFNLLRYLKYLVDTLSSNNVLLGVGRGSSVASFALYKLKVHRIDSLYYELDIHEFLHS